MPKADCLAWATRLESSLLAFHRGGKVSPLREHPDTEAVESWMRSVYLGTWANRVRYVPKS